MVTFILWLFGLFVVVLGVIYLIELLDEQIEKLDGRNGYFFNPDSEYSELIEEIKIESKNKPVKKKPTKKTIKKTVKKKKK